MKRRFLPLAAAFSMMAAAADEQQPAAAREALPAPNGERYDPPGASGPTLARAADDASGATTATDPEAQQAA